MKALLEQFSIGLFFWQTLIFLILILVLKKYAWKAILDSIDKREQTIKDALENSKIVNQKLNQTTIEINKMIREANIKRSIILQETYELKKKIISDAKKEALDESNRIIQLSKINILHEKEQTMIELKKYIGLISINILEKVLTKEFLNKKTQKELIKHLISQLNVN